MANLERGQLRMRKNHEWKSKPGYQIFVVNRGEVRFDYPRDWVFVPPKSILEPYKFHDKKPPDDDCILQLTIFHAPPESDWTGLPIDELMLSITDHDSDESPDMVRGEVHFEKRKHFDIAWREGRYTDTKENRLAITRSCIARDKVVVPLFTLDFWVDDLDRVSPIWDEMIRSLRLGDMVQDPRTGRVNRLDARGN